MPEEGKVCLDCGTPIFPPRKKFCSAKHKNRYNHKHLYKYKYQLTSINSTPRKYMSTLLSFYGRRKTLSLDYLESLYVKQEGRCALSGVEMTYLQGQGKLKTNISIDKILPSRGYVEGNIQLVCTIVNTMKHTMSVEELKEWCKKIVEND